jgi:hypothetical protein
MPLIRRTAVRVMPLTCTSARAASMLSLAALSCKQDEQQMAGAAAAAVQVRMR